MKLDLLWLRHLTILRMICSCWFFDWWGPVAYIWVAEEV